jgi:hypothetical protein
MLRMWLVRISPAIGNLEGRTTLVGNGRTRDVIGQTIARPVFSGKGGGRNHKGRALTGLLPAFGRVEIRPDQIARVGQIFRSRHSSTISRPTSGPPIKGSGIGRSPLCRAPPAKQLLQGETRNRTADDDFPVMRFDFETLAIAEPSGLHNLAREANG